MCKKYNNNNDIATNKFQNVKDVLLGVVATEVHIRNKNGNDNDDDVAIHKVVSLFSVRVCDIRIAASYSMSDVEQITLNIIHLCNCWENLYTYDTYEKASFL